MLSFFDSNRRETPVALRIASCYGNIEAIIITDLGKTDEEETWLFRGQRCNSRLEEKEKLVNGLFSTKTRKGWVEVYF